MNRLYIFLFLIGCLAACSESTAPSAPVLSDRVNAPTTTSIPSRALASNLSQEYASFRKNQIDNVRYQLFFDLMPSDDHYKGQSLIQFELKQLDQPVTIDFTQGNVASITVNNKSLAVDYNGWFITVAAEDLKLGSNEVKIDYQHAYSQDGSGLHRFQDPEDNKIYLYSDFEPFDANRMFPCFDQPNLKAQYQVTVKAPKHYQVASFIRESRVDELSDANEWFFDGANRQRFSTYIFSLHAGEYKVWSDESYRYPLRLMARQSLAKFIDPKLWFNYTKQGFEFFEPYFKVAYPYTKYDQLIVPDFNAGAMENVAAVTFSEFFVYRNQPTREQRARLANVIFHEMAHMWFGNLVTMDWWNGLWLNESFATYMANLGLSQATEFKTDNWQRFYIGTKQGGYLADQRVTTHPIELPVIDTDSSFANFDAITYNKGASVLKQLSHYLDEEVFRQGVSNYLNQHQEKNTQLSDFIESLSQASGKKLDTWSDQWLFKASVNTIKTQYQCEDNKITQFQLIQSSLAGYDTLREHKLQVGLYLGQADGVVSPITVIPTDVVGVNTPVAQAIGLPCPDLVYPNHGDWGYVKVQLDEKTLANSAQLLPGIDDSLLRSMYWQSLWDNVLDAHLSVLAYVNLAVKLLAQEPDQAVFRQGLLHLSEAFNYLAKMQHQVKNTELTQAQEKIEQALWQWLNETDISEDKMRLLADQYLRVSHSDIALATLTQALSKNQLAGLALDQDLRWQIIVRINAFSAQDALIKAELAQDASDRGQKWALQAQSIQPGLTNKQLWLSKITENSQNLGLSKLRQAMRGFWPEYQNLPEDLIKDILTPLSQENDLEYLQAYGGLMVPERCNTRYITQLQEFIDGQELGLTIRKLLLLKRQESQRCVDMLQVL